MNLFKSMIRMDGANLFSRLVILPSKKHKWNIPNIKKKISFITLYNFLEYHSCIHYINGK